MVLETLDEPRDGSGLIDEERCEEWRTKLLAAGATVDEIDAMAVFLVTEAILLTPDDRERRREYCEVVSRHLACTDMTIRIGHGKQFIRVEFPGRPTVQ